MRSCQCASWLNRPGLTPDEQCSKPATWYVDGTPLCSPHKGFAMRGYADPRLAKVEDIIASYGLDEPDDRMADMARDIVRALHS